MTIQNGKSKKAGYIFFRKTAFFFDLQVKKRD